MDLKNQVELITEVVAGVAADKNKIIRFAIKADPVRPFDSRDKIPGISLIDCDGMDFWAYEDAGMASGAFLAAESLRFEMDGSHTAFINARNTFEGICHIYRLGMKKCEGFFPKPYGGKFSEHFSRDQYLMVMDGLARFYRIADASQKELCLRMICAMSDYWRGIDYSTTYFSLGRASHLRDHIAGMFLGVAYIPYLLTRQKKYYDEFIRLLEQENLGSLMDLTLRSFFRSGRTYDNAMFFRQNENACMLKCIALDYLCRHDDERRGYWRQCLEHLLTQDIFIELSEKDSLNYSIMKYDPSSDSVSLTGPGVIEALDNPLKLSILNWGGRRRNPGSAQSAFSALVAAAHLDRPDGADKAAEVLAGFTLPKFASLTVDSPADIPPEREFELGSLRVSCMAFYLYSYQLLRLLTVPACLGTVN